jgi:hypothetical protein
VLGLSLTTTVTNWDTAMLSESLALSAMALLLAMALRYVRAPSARTVWPVLAAWVLWIWTRQNNLVLGLLVLLALALLVGWQAVRRLPVDRPLLGLLAGLVAITALAGFTYSRNTEIVHYNLAQIIGNRVLPDSDRTDWFIDHGMPSAWWWARRGRPRTSWPTAPSTAGSTATASASTPGTSPCTRGTRSPSRSSPS